MSSIASDPCDNDIGCVKGLERPLYALSHLKGLALGWWTQEKRLCALQENTHPLTWEELKRLMRFKYVPKGYTKLFNVNPRRLVLRTKVGICGALRFDLVTDDGYNLNYITLEVVAYLGLPRIQRTYPYTMEGCKVTEGVRISFTRGKYYEEFWCDIMPMASCHLSLGANWFTEDGVPNEKNRYKCVVDHWGTHIFPHPKVKSERQKIERSKGKQGGNLRVEKKEAKRSEVRGLPQSQSNIVVHPSLGKDSYVGISIMNRGTHAPAKEPTIEGVMDALRECPNIQGKKDLSCGRQGTIANLNTFTIANEQSVNVSLSLCEPIDSLPCVDSVLVENVDTLVNPIDDRIDSSSKIDLCPPSVDTYTLNASSLFYIDCVDQPACDCSSLVEGPCSVIKEPQVSGTNDNIDQLNRSDSMSISFVEDSIAYFAHRDHVLENTSKNDMFLSEGELACFNSSLAVDHSLFKYNILFEDDEITFSDVPSGVKLESSIVLDSYTCYSNPLWCEAFPPKDGNLFLEDESTLVGKECDEEEGGVFFSVTFSSWYVSLLDGMTNAFEPIGSHTHENNLDEVNLRDIFLYYLFTYDEAHAVEWSILFEGKSTNLVNGCALDPSTWLAFPFNPNIKLFLRFYHSLEEPALCVVKDSFLDPFSISYPEHDLVECAAMTIDDVWLFLEFESPRLNVLSANLCTIPHTKRISFFLMIYVILQGLDSRTQFYLLDIKEALCLMGCETNEGLHMNLFKCIGSSALPLCQCVLLSQVSITLMGCKPFVATCDTWLYVIFMHPWHSDEIVIVNANPHAIRIFVLFASPMVLQGMDLRTNPFQEGENDAIQIAPNPFIHEFQHIDRSFSKMEVRGHGKCASKELPAEQHPVWMIAWSVGGPTRQGGAKESVAPFGEVPATLVIRRTPLARVPGSPTDPMSCRERLSIRLA
ncbi:hypothetical protein KY285_004878 [Solanum tuberosum]|nr:hypothetical protein KY285_004878 [Solanum tuberosum]